MASNHVQQPDSNLQNGSMFDGSESSFFQQHNLNPHQGQQYGLSYQQPQHTHLNGTPSHSPYNDASAFSPPQTWQHQTSNAIPPNPYLRPGFYPGQASNNVNNYYSGQGAQYNQNVDPSLLRQSMPGGYGQTMGRTSMPSHSPSTIAPTSLHQQPPLNRPTAAPATSMQNVFNMQTMNSIAPQKITPSPAANGTGATQPSKVPKSMQSGNFVIVNYEDMARATQSKKLAQFVNVGIAPVDLNLTKGKLCCHCTTACD